MVFVGFGWGKPVPVNPNRLQGNRRASWALVSAAGPFSNLVLAMLALLPYRMGFGLYLPEKLSSAVGSFVLLNLFLMLFNLIPVPPLDGSRILGWLIPEGWARALDQLERYAGPALILLIFALSRTGVLSKVILPFLEMFLDALIYY